MISSMIDNWLPSLQFRISPVSFRNMGGPNVTLSTNVVAVAVLEYDYYAAQSADHYGGSADWLHANKIRSWILCYFLHVLIK